MTRACISRIELQSYITPYFSKIKGHRFATKKKQYKEQSYFLRPNQTQLRNPHSKKNPSRDIQREEEPEAVETARTSNPEQSRGKPKYVTNSEHTKKVKFISRAPIPTY